MGKKRADDFEFELNMEIGRKRHKKKSPVDAVEKLFDPSKFSISNAVSSYSDFIDKYNSSDSDVVEEDRVDGVFRKKNKGRIRSEAEQEFLDDFSSKANEFDYSDLTSGHSFFRVFVSSLFVVLVCVVVALLFKINSLNAQLSDVKLQINENAQAKEKLQQVLIENEKMKKMIEDLSNGEVAEEAVASNEQENKGEEVVTPQDNVSSNKDTNYVVQVGDTLSSISKKFYGTSSAYKKIVERNNLTSEVLSPNQKLIIPAK